MTSVSGIYVILHKKSGKIYLGQAQNITHRWKQHRWALNRGNHDNQYLQRAWDKYGAKAFQFKILERCAVDQLDEREQHYLNIHIPKGCCYNIACDVSHPNRGRNLSIEHKRKIGDVHKGRILSAEHRHKISVNNGAHQPRTAEHSRNQSLAQMGREVSTSTRNKIGEANSGRFVVISPDGIETEIHGLSGFCRVNNLTVGNMSAVANGKRKHHKGWICRKIT